MTSDPAGGTGSTVGATSTTVTGLSNGVSYTFTVTATNAIGTSDPSAPSNSVTPTGFQRPSPTPPKGGTAGVSVTTGNSGGASGNAFTVVSRGSGATLIYSASAAAHGALGYSIKGSSGQRDLRGLERLQRTVDGDPLLLQPRPHLAEQGDAAGGYPELHRDRGTSRAVGVQPAVHPKRCRATVATFAHPVQANTWYRIELTISITSSAATIKAAYYPADSTVPVDPAYSTTTGNTGTANIAQVSIGRRQTRPGPAPATSTIWPLNPARRPSSGPVSHSSPSDFALRLLGNLQVFLKPARPISRLLCSLG